MAETKEARVVIIEHHEGVILQPWHMVVQAMRRRQPREEWRQFLEGVPLMNAGFEFLYEELTPEGLYRMDNPARQEDNNGDSN